MPSIALIYCLDCNEQVLCEVHKTPDRITWYCPKCGKELDSEYVDYDYYDYEGRIEP